MITIDGSQGEGGGQVLRTALGLSLATGTPFRIERIRAGRAKSGLLRQHLASVRAAAAIGDAEVEGDELRSAALTFRPQRLVPGDHRVAIGSAGSAMLVVQAVLPGLLAAGGPSRLVVEGGTHNPFAPPCDFVQRVFVPLLERMGARVHVHLERHGFFPAGGGRVMVEVEPAVLQPLTLLERGEVRAMRAEAVVSGVRVGVARRELAVLGERFGLAADALVATEVRHPVGPGNVVMLEVRCEHATELFTAFGERGVPAEAVAWRVADEAEAWLARDAPVDDHLADQLLVPVALAGGGRFRCGPPTPHAKTNADVIARFTARSFTLSELGGDLWEIALGD